MYISHGRDEDVASHVSDVIYRKLVKTSKLISLVIPYADLCVFTALKHGIKYPPGNGVN